LLPYALKQVKQSRDPKLIQSMLNAVLRYTVLKEVDGQIEAENIFHYIAKHDFAN
jgi:hypothetical protein